MAGNILDRIRSMARQAPELDSDAPPPKAGEDGTLLLAGGAVRERAHELLSLVELLGETDLTQDQRHYLAAVRSSGDAIVRVLDQALELARIEAGRLDLVRRPFELAEPIDRAVEAIAPLAQSAGIDLAASIAPGVDRRQVGDAGRIEQMLIALLQRSIVLLEDAPTEASGIHLIVVDEPGASAGRRRIRIEIRVVGLDGALPERLADEEIDLGLRMTAGLAARMGGMIGADGGGDGSAAGSDLWMVIELDPPEPPASEAADRLGAGQRALVCDDDAASRAALAVALSGLGFTVDAVADAETALTALTLGDRDGLRFDLAVIDEDLQETDGLALCRCIRLLGVHGGIRLVLTGDDHARRGQRYAIRRGFDGTLAKPIRPGALARTLAWLYGLGPHGAVRRPRRTEPAGAVADGAKARILIADPNQVARLLAVAALRMDDYSVDGVGDGIALVEAAATQAYDVILLDLDLPELDGMEAARRIRALHGPSGRARLIALGESDHETLRRCRQAGIDHILTKPLEPALVLDAVAGRAAPA